MLTGITMQLLRLGLEKLGIPDEERRLTSESLTGMRAAAATNSHSPAQPIAAIDGTAFRDHAALTILLRRAWREVSWEMIRESEHTA
jgi:branched-subunit amino acid aminotransferase/4-amino-4-deoxychorismate lyase